MKEETKQLLISYLADHEEDIAWGENDFGELKPVFIEFIGRDPIKTQPLSQLSQHERNIRARRALDNLASKQNG